MSADGSRDRPASRGSSPRGERRRDRREQACRALAEDLATPEGLRAVRLGQLTGLVGPGPREEALDAAEPEPPAEPVESPRPISIWEPATLDGEPTWIRPPVGPLGDHYAAARVLRPRKNDGPPCRIVWLGESAAAGYLYAPHLTPARVLEDRLRSLAGPDAYEVIDLARTNETLETLVETAERALQLEPDLVAVYAGNNWRLLETPEVSPHVPSVRSRQEIAAAFDHERDHDRESPGERRPWAGPAGLARKRLAGRAAAALDRLASLAHGARIPLLLVLPEVNLADWESRQPPVWLPGDGSPRWYRLLDEALEALAREDWVAAEEAAWAMNTLDGSSCPTPFRILARAWEGAGHAEEARDAARAEVDAVHYPLLCFLDAPRAGTDARNLLAEAARRHDLPTVDLRTVLAEPGRSPLAGRRHFLDYCHLTSDGMAALGTAVADRILRLLPPPGGRAVPCGTQSPEPMTPEISPAAEATARLGAALHGAHRLLPLTTAHEILEHWCDRALEADPGVARAMVHLTTMRLALLDGAPAVLTEAFRRLQASTYRMTLQHGLRWGNLDGAVIRAITAALRVAGRPEAEEIGRLIENAAERLRLPVDLAAGERFLAAPLERLFPEVMDSADPTLHGRTTLRAHWPVTAFDLPLSRRSRRAPLRLELVARLPAVPGADRVRTGTARLTIEGHPLGHAVLGDAWTRAPFDLDPEALQPGLHRLAIHWPRLPPVGTQALEAARRTLQLGRQADLHPVFGEIESMRVLPPPREGRSLRSHHGRHGGTAASSRGPDADTGGREDVGDKPPAQTCGAQVPISSPLPRTRR